MMKIDLEKISSWLKHSSYFSQLPEGMFQKITALATIRKFNQGDVFLQQGQLCQEAYMIVEGNVSVEVDGNFIYNLTSVLDKNQLSRAF